VEDNPVNKIVATEILSSADITIHKAGNGFEAIEILKEMEFDAVLMDIQMPGMDGIEATGIIRNDLNQNQLPIIAMTANAMTGDREKCISAGMNDYISKPIESKQIFSVLARWINTEKSSISKISSEISVHQPHLSESSTRVELDMPDSLPGIDITSGLLRVNGNKQLYISLLKEFHMEHFETIEKIKKALSHDNPEYAGALIHAVKGSSGNNGANKAYHSAKALEVGIHLDRRPSENLLKKFEADLSEVLESTVLIQDIVSETFHPETRQISTGEALNITELAFMLSKLKKMLEKNSFAAETYLHSILKHLDPEARTKAKRLANHVNCLEYAHAKVELLSFAETMNIPMD
jgi:polar amino acid transport system substrate-binding protein